MGEGKSYVFAVGSLHLPGPEGLVVLLRPGKSLWFLAVVVGIAVITTGVMEIAVAFADRERIRHWVLLALLGVAGVVVGVLAIAWPQITVWVLALLIGSGADYLVTGDKDLLALAGTCPILTPANFVDRFVP